MALHVARLTMGDRRGLVARVKRHSERFFALALVLGGLGGTLWTAPAMASTPSDRSVAESIVDELSKLPENELSVVRSALDRAQHALKRATSAKDAGDVRGAELLEGVAREWAETGKALLRAARAETSLKTLQLQAAETSQKAERARMLLEELVIRKGRAEAELRSLEGPAVPKPATKEAAR